MYFKLLNLDGATVGAVVANNLTDAAHIGQAIYPHYKFIEHINHQEYLTNITHKEYFSK